MNLTAEQNLVMSSSNHLLVTGGPGSGKTTISILKAAHISEHELNKGQKVLFLSFARATISRVIEAIEHEQSISPEIKKRIDVDTYHAFFWRVLKTHGYLLGLPRKLQILAPHEEAVALSEIRSRYAGKKLSQQDKIEKRDLEERERYRLAREEGKICFDFFAKFTLDIIQPSSQITELISEAFPVIIVDEFQDTNQTQWNVIKALGSACRIISLADQEQRIFEWIGADPKRLDHFKSAFQPDVVDLSDVNHRSAGTDIAVFGNDVLTGNYREEAYKGVSIELFDALKAPAFTKLITTVYTARKRLIASGKPDWSLAVLVPTKKMTRLVSDAFRSPPSSLTPISHNAVIDVSGAILAAETIAHLLNSFQSKKEHFFIFVELVCNFFEGKGGEKPSLSNLKEAQKIRESYSLMQEKLKSGKKLSKGSVIFKIVQTYQQVLMIEYTGDPEKDWLTVRQTLENGSCTRLKKLAIEAKNVRILDRGTELRSRLALSWNNSHYLDALNIVKDAFTQEHFATKSKPESGVVVMNMHKSKGKQFDEVIIFEGWPTIVRRKIVANNDRIVRLNDKENIDTQSRQNLRVSITRGKQHTTLLTPKVDPCVILTQRP
ncbi:UvrD-helicase domain-containing protein [Thiomicrorhabdus chilensis]|uniref:UvrD-helicase domain-containing protein n=1 Tax=Thiomicrorhabdus chilensis TaxID=63656 RepID=UPI0004917C92|nr:UvrD-helicase domain-containing protein [Thiomicrorhabdus chilensis]